MSDHPVVDNPEPYVPPPGPPIDHSANLYVPTGPSIIAPDKVVVIDATHPIEPAPAYLDKPDWMAGYDAGWKAGWPAALAPPPAPVEPTVESHMVGLFEHVLGAMKTLRDSFPTASGLRYWVAEGEQRLARAAGDLLPPVVDAAHPPPTDGSADFIAGWNAGWTASWPAAWAAEPRQATVAGEPLTPQNGHERFGV